ncbi:MAG: FkbM family methyltransferase [Methylocystaceae bacterium]|nr:FkbM family methyltransferase [Methylocystaceae bacterium]
MNQLNKLLLSLRWRIRMEAGIKYASESEMRYRLSRLSEPGGSGAHFPFPWGTVEYRSASDLRGQYTEIFVNRHYAIQSPNHEPCIVDAGGNIGMSAIWFMQNYPRANLTVYEADPSLVQVLKRNLTAASCAGVDVKNAAVWTSDGTVRFDNAGHDRGAVCNNGAIAVPSVDIASHLPARVDLLKLDIEGAEYGVINRLCDTNSISRVQNLAAEFHVRRGDIDDALESLQRLRSAGMQVCITSSLGGWLGLSELRSNFEVVEKNQMLMEVYAWRQ